MHQGLFKNIACHKVYWHFISHCICVYTVFVYLHVRPLGTSFLTSLYPVVPKNIAHAWSIVEQCLSSYMPFVYGSPVYLLSVLLHIFSDRPATWQKPWSTQMLINEVIWKPFIQFTLSPCVNFFLCNISTLVSQWVDNEMEEKFSYALASFEFGFKSLGKRGGGVNLISYLLFRNSKYPKISAKSE